MIFGGKGSLQEDWNRVVAAWMNGLLLRLQLAEWERKGACS